MVDPLSLVRGAWLVMAVLVALLLVEIAAWRGDLAYNEALRERRWMDAAEVASGERADAAAAFATPDREFDEKVVLLSRLAAGGTEPGDALFNLANLYLRRALAMDAGEDQDIVMPLVEQAKQHYRTLLTADPDDWEAKYNLELALALLPEVAAVDPDEEVNPERSERAISTMRVEEQLP